VGARRGKKHEHVNHERWLVSYADFITLLFAFFVVMFAVSQVDSNKLGRFAESLNNAFQEGGIFLATRGTLVAQGGGGGSSIVPQIVGDRPSFMQYKSPSLQAEILRDAVEQVLSEAGLSGQVALRYDPRGVVVALYEKSLFGARSADLLPAAPARLRTLARAIAEAPGAIQVQTHVDESFPGSGQQLSPWELGALRAARVAQFLSEENDLEPGRVSTASFAEPWSLSSAAELESLPSAGRIELILVTEEPPEGP